MRLATVSSLAHRVTRAAIALAVLSFGPTAGQRLAPNQAAAEEWRRIFTGAGPSIRRQEGLVVDQQADRLVVAGGENADGRTWALELFGSGAWIDLGILTPQEASDVVQAIYDSQDRKMLLVTPSLNVYALDLVNPTAWTLFSPAGAGPGPRRYPAVAYDKRRNRLLLFGGGPDTGGLCRRLGAGLEWRADLA